MFKFFHKKVDLNREADTQATMEGVEKEINKWIKESDKKIIIQDFRLTSISNDRNDFAELFFVVNYKLG